MSDEIIEGSLTPPKPTGDAAVLAAFREVTGWTDDDVLHYATCLLCTPICGYEESDCSDSPKEQRWRAERASRRPYSEPVRPQAPLPAALRRVGEQIVQDAKRRPLNHRH